MHIDRASIEDMREELAYHCDDVWDDMSQEELVLTCHMMMHLLDHTCGTVNKVDNLISTFADLLSIHDNKLHEYEKRITTLEDQLNNAKLS